MVIPVPITIALFFLFGLAYGVVMLQACRKRVYKISGLYWLDAGLLVWLLALFSGIAFFPALYLASSFHEFGATPTGQQLTKRINWLARGQVAYVCLYGLLVLTTVKQR